MYEVGKIYIWQNQVGVLEFLNGSETTVLTPPKMTICAVTGKKSLSQDTDTFLTAYGGLRYLSAEAGDLRPKDPPKGEQSILDLFKLPQTEPA